MDMQELAQMEYPLGMPMAWLFDTQGVMLKDADGRPLSRYLTEFEYVYDEEEDDRCDMTLQFDSIDKYDLPYLTHDVILLVQWGFVTPGGEVIKSPQRKVAIRDITTSYSNKGFVMNIKCTDLVAYLKAYTTNTIRSSGNALVAKLENYFAGWLKEIANGQYTANIINDTTSVRYGKDGQVTVGDFDSKLNTVRNQVVGGRASDSFYYLLYEAKVIKGKNINIDGAIRASLEGMEGISNGQPSKLLMDGMDDNIVIRPRNFDQIIYKAFLWQNGIRNFIDFKNNTNTRKIEEDVATTSDINPYSKESETTQVNYEDEEDNKDVNEPNKPKINSMGLIDYTPDYSELLKILKEEERIASLPKYSEAQIKYEASKPGIPDSTKIKNIKLVTKLEENRIANQDTARAVGYLNQLTDNFKEATIDDPLTQRELTKLKDSTFIDDQSSKPANEKLKGFLKFNTQARAIISKPIFQDQQDRRIKSFEAATRALLNKGIEKIQRKHEATATVMGDPSLIKARTYGFFGLSKKDSGKWYCTTVSHKISSGNGYICSMDLLKAPKNIAIAELKFKEKRSYLSKEETIELNQYLSSEIKVIAKGTGELSAEELSNYEVDTVRGINDRIEVLRSQEDYKIE